ncbi:MAG TPA: tRNA (adenosine(37)-N6)-threonylcarbamoyltransferase complex dimerization subunit type 1 TsaB [Patescibacteria group bacterium]|jgi:tRNA threonylcarbamoyladenosine biosynthesis protein TsaB|nr:tRNA (adenosine(37)-N6)-threonylcarbamoyltransferase complex dimerization subunit type 1 TsaB [Patescibacteria group bacterium]
MIILLDTSTPECRLTLVHGNESKDFTWQADRELATGLLGFIRDCLADQNATFSDISGIGVLKGPGSFTGLRIGMTVANTLADSLQVPIVGEVSSEWQSKALQRLSDGENDTMLLPEYGGDANITKPRK